MQRRHDHFEGGLFLEFRVRIDRDAPAIIADCQSVARFQRNLDAIGMAGHRFVHRIVEDFCSKVMQRPLIGAANIHAGATPDRLEPLQHLDRGCIIVIGRVATRLACKEIRHADDIRIAESLR